jgi:hypothetical protein
MGLIVDPVDEVTTITPAEIEPIPEFGGPIDRSRLLVLAKVKGQVKTLLSIEQVIKTGRDSAIAPPLPPFRRAANNTPELATKTILAAVGSITLAADAALITPKKSRERSGVDLLCNSIRAPPLVEAQRIRQSISQLGVGESFDRPKVIEEFRPSGDRRNSTLYKTIPVVAAGDAAGRTASEDGLNFRAAKHQSRPPRPRGGHSPCARPARRRGLLPGRPRHRHHRARPSRDAHAGLHDVTRRSRQKPVQGPQ